MVVNNVLSASTEAADLGGAFSPERWAYAGQMTLLGMLMIFSVLAILWGVLALFKVIFAQKKRMGGHFQTRIITHTPQKFGIFVIGCYPINALHAQLGSNPHAVSRSVGILPH